MYDIVCLSDYIEIFLHYKSKKINYNKILFDHIKIRTIALQLSAAQ